MDKRFRNQLLAENRVKEEEVKTINLEIEDREVSKNGPFVLIRNKKNNRGFYETPINLTNNPLNNKVTELTLS